MAFDLPHLAHSTQCRPAFRMCFRRSLCGSVILATSHKLLPYFVLCKDLLTV